MFPAVHQHGARQERHLPHPVRLHARRVRPGSRREAGRVLVRRRRSPAHRDDQQDHPRATRQVQLARARTVMI